MVYIVSDFGHTNIFEMVMLMGHWSWNRSVLLLLRIMLNAGVYLHKSIEDKALYVEQPVECGNNRPYCLFTFDPTASFPCFQLSIKATSE